MITTDEVISFVRKNEGREFKTIARETSFTIYPYKDGIRFRIQSGSIWPVKREFLDRYIEEHNKLSVEGRTKPSKYPKKWRERSYATALFKQVADEKPSRPKSDGLNDLSDAPAGSASPDRATRVTKIVVRDNKVRDYVLKVAAGKCEYCGHEGFLMTDGGRYLETHHIIFLHKDGKDTPANVIALCASHHREAHFGKDAEALEKQFLSCIKKRQSRLKA